MSIQKTTTALETLKINYLTQAMYEDALENDEIEENELYMSSYTPNYIVENNSVTTSSDFEQAVMYIYNGGNN